MASRSFVQWRAPPGRHEPRPLHRVWVDGVRDGSWGEWWVAGPLEHAYWTWVTTIVFEAFAGGTSQGSLAPSLSQVESFACPKTQRQPGHKGEQRLRRTVVASQRPKPSGTLADWTGAVGAGQHAQTKDTKASIALGTERSRATAVPDAGVSHGQKGTYVPVSPH